MNSLISLIWDFLKFHYMSVGQNLSMLKILFHISQILESLQPWGCFWRDYATQEADQELKWKLRTISVWKNWVLEFLGSHIWDTRGGDSTSKSPGGLGLNRTLKSGPFCALLYTINLASADLHLCFPLLILLQWNSVRSMNSRDYPHISKVVKITFYAR